MLQIQPPEVFRPFTVQLPVSKSEANRLMIIRFLADGSFDAVKTDSDDTVIMQSLLKRMTGQPRNYEYNAGDAGTVFRFLAALMAVTPGNRLLTGSLRMLQRPCAPLVDALLSLGADIEYAGETGFPPLKIRGKNLQGGQVAVDASVSSQFVSALMMIAPCLEKGLEIKLEGEAVSKPYIRLTASLMQQNGVETALLPGLVRIRPGQYNAVSPYSEADWSAAAFWYALAALSPGCEITLEGLNPASSQGDSAAIKLFARLGVESVWNNRGLLLRGGNSGVKELEIDFSDFPDMVPAMAVACAGNGVKAVFTGLSTLRIKESDRIEALVDGLTRLGFRAQSAASDRLEIFPEKDEPKTGIVSSRGDHRIAMAFAMLSVKTGKVLIEQPEVVSKSYPAFTEHLKLAGFSLKEI